MWKIANCENGVSSYELTRTLKISQKSTWFMSHRIREAMKSGTFEKMAGTVEFDETYVGGLEMNKHEPKKLKSRSGAVGKAIVQGVIESGQGSRKSRVSATVVKATDATALQSTLKEIDERGTAVYTDAYKGYNGLNVAFVHDFIDHAVKYAEGAVHTNGI